MDFRGVQGIDRVRMLYCDNTGELVGSGHNLGWMVNASTPGKPKSNRAVERIVGRVTEGTRTNLQQSGLDVSWWPWAGRQFAFAWNVSLFEGACPCLARHEKQCDAKHVRFGAVVPQLSFASRASNFFCAPALVARC